MDKNIAVVGCGYWGKNLVRNFAHLGALHTLCDTNDERLQQQAALYSGLNLETDFVKLLKMNEIQGVIIATPAVLHYPMTKEALLAGKDVFVEKPLALRVEDGRELVELAEEKGRILMVGHVLEYHPIVAKLKELVDKGELGKIQYIYSNRLNLGKFRTEENILWSFAPHDISVILLLTSEMPKEVSAHGGYYLHQDIADVTLTTMSFASGVQAHIFVSWLHPYKEQKLVIVGDRRMALFDDVAPEQKLLLYSHKIDWVNRLPIPRPKDAQPIEFTTAEPLQLECQHFLDCIKTRQRPKTDGHNGLRVLQVLDACQRSLQENGRAVSLFGMFRSKSAGVPEQSRLPFRTKSVTVMEQIGHPAGYLDFLTMSDGAGKKGSCPSLWDFEGFFYKSLTIISHYDVASLGLWDDKAAERIVGTLVSKFRQAPEG